MIIGPRRSDRRSEFFLHPCVQALLAADGSTGCPRQAVRNRVGAVTAEAMAFGWEGPPFDVEVLASLRGMAVERADWLSDDQDGCFVPGSPPVIFVNRTIPRVRARYTVAHEIVHTLLPESGATSDSRHWKYRFDGQSPVEQLCQVGASELLMPSTVLKEQITGRLESLELATELSRSFDVSLEAAVRNLVDLSPNPCAMVVLRLMHKPSERRAPAQAALPGFEEPTPPKRLRIQYGWTSRAWDDHYLPQFKSVPDDSIAYAALEAAGRNGGEILTADEDWSEVGGLGLCRVEVIKLSSGPSNSAVLCFLTPSHYS